MQDQLTTKAASMMSPVHGKLTDEKAGDGVGRLSRTDATGQQVCLNGGRREAVEGNYASIVMDDHYEREAMPLV